MAFALAACGAQTSVAPPTPVVTATAPPAPATPPPRSTLAPGQPTPDATAQPSEVEDAFLSNVDDLTAEAADLASTPCEDLTMVTSANPNLVPSIHGFAATLKRVGASQAALNSDAVHTALADLDRTISQLDSALSTCGIKSQP
jgi:hypothetical protein